MTVNARIASIRLIEKIHRLPGYAERLGLSVQVNESTSKQGKAAKET